MDGQVMTILGSQLGPGKGSDGLQFTPWGDAVLLGSRLDLEKLLGRQALGRGPVPPDTAPLRVAGLSCPAGMHLLFAFWSPPSGVLTGGPGFPLSSSERVMGVVLGEGFPGVLGKHSARSALVGGLAHPAQEPHALPFPHAVVSPLRLPWLPLSQSIYYPSLRDKPPKSAPRKPSRRGCRSPPHLPSAFLLKQFEDGW